MEPLSTSHYFYNYIEKVNLLTYITFTISININNRSRIVIQKITGSNRLLKYKVRLLSQHFHNHELYMTIHCLYKSVYSISCCIIYIVLKRILNSIHVYLNDGSSRKCIDNRGHLTLNAKHHADNATT